MIQSKFFHNLTEGELNKFLKTTKGTFIDFKMVPVTQKLNTPNGDREQVTMFGVLIYDTLEGIGSIQK